MNTLTSKTDTFTLHNGLQIPCIGFGTWQLKEGEECYSSVINALAAGYRHIDTAAVYKNEISVGKAIVDSNVNREDIFVTTKVWNTDRGFDTTLAALEQSLQRLGMDYVDLYLIHWPAVPKQFENWKEINAQTWLAMEELYRSGKVKAIGVSNFRKHHIEALLDTAIIIPMVNQIEIHPGFTQEETVAFCNEHHILVEGWSPLGKGGVLNNDTLLHLADKYQCSSAQICINWALSHNILPLPRTTKKERAFENADVFDFTLSKSDVEIIDQLKDIGGSGVNPDAVDF